MSFLDSVLSSISDEPSSIQPAVGATKPAPAPLVKKRKSDVNATDAVPAKAPRLESSSTPKTSPVLLKSTRSITPQVRSSASSSSKPSLQKHGSDLNRISKPLRPVPSLSAIPRSSSSNDSGPNTKPATKSAYLAILEKAKAAHEAANQTSQIRHVKTERLTKRQKLQRRRLEAEMQSTPTGQSAKKGIQDPRPRAEQGPDGATKRPVRQESSYTGTMRTGNSSHAARKLNKPGRELSETEDEDLDELMDSEASSDMEAGYDDVEGEEEVSARIARREDLAAAEEEQRLKRAKMERQRKLLALQAAARKKGRSY